MSLPERELRRQRTGWETASNAGGATEFWMPQKSQCGSDFFVPSCLISDCGGNVTTGLQFVDVDEHGC